MSKGPSNGESPASSSETPRVGEPAAPAPSSGRVLLKNLTPSRFWAMVEPYCAEITPDDIRYLEEQIKACEDIGEYMKIPSLGRHYAEMWAEEDLATERDSKSSKLPISFAVMLNEAKTSRPRPELRGRGQDYEAEAKAKNNYEKVPNND